MMFKKQSGFSLLEIMVAAALLGGLALAGAKLMENQTKSMKTIEVKGEYTAVLAEIRSVLAIEDSCIRTFSQTVPPYNPNIQAVNSDLTPTVAGIIPYIRQKPASATDQIIKYEAATNPSDWRTAKAYGNGNVRILSYKLSDVLFNAGTLPDGSRTGSANLVIRMQSGSAGRTMGADVIDRKIPLSIEANASNIITKCSSSGTTGLDNRYLIKAQGGVVTGPINMRNAGSNIVMEANTVIDVNNQAYILLRDNSFIDFVSDRNFKYDIKELNNLAPSLRKLKPVTYKWKSSGKDAYGFIAQDLELIFPRLVKRTGPDKSRTVDYIQMIPLMVRGFQEVDAENAELRKTITKLEKEMDQLKKIICRHENDPELCKGKR